MSRLGRAVGRAWRAPRRYGLFWSVIYIGWALLSTRSFRIPRTLRNGILGMAVRVFVKLGIHQIQVPVNGVNLYIDPRNPWSLRMYALQPHYDLAEISAVKKAVPAKYTFIDVGANFGAWSISLAGHFSRVLGVEPDGRCYRCCEETLRKLQLANVGFVNVALAEHECDGLLFASASHIGDSRVWNPGDPGRLEGIPVRIMSFDSLVDQEKVNSEHMFIKLDAQGVEPAIVRGMKHSLVKAQDVILFTEIQQTVLASAGSSVRGYLALLDELQFRPVDLFSELSETSWDEAHDRLTTARDYCFRRTRANPELSAETW